MAFGRETDSWHSQAERRSFIPQGPQKIHRRESVATVWRAAMLVKRASPYLFSCPQRFCSLPPDEAGTGQECIKLGHL